MENYHCTKVDRNEGKRMKIQNNQKANNKMTVVSPYISINTPNINGLNSPIKNHRLVG